MAISLKAARVNAGLTQIEAAKKLGVNSTTISFWETGRTSPRTSTFFALCKLYGVDPNDIFLPKESN